jgi:hypothetical protein
MFNISAVLIYINYGLLIPSLGVPTVSKQKEIIGSKLHLAFLYSYYRSTIILEHKSLLL